MERLLQTLEQNLSAIAQNVLAPPLRDDELNEVQRNLRFVLAPEHAALLRWHNGGREANSGRRGLVELVPRYRLLAASEIPRHVRALNAGLPQWQEYVPVCAHRTAPAWIAYSKATDVPDRAVVKIDSATLDFPCVAVAFDSITRMFETLNAAFSEGALFFVDGELKDTKEFDALARRMNLGATAW